MRSSIRFAGQVFLVCIAALLVLSLFQRHLIYFPTVFESYNADIIKQKNLTVVTGDNLEWLVSPYTGTGGKNAVVVLFHGNGGAAIDRYSKAALFNTYGYDVVLAEYPGYGTNGHLQPNEDAFYEAGRDIIRKTKHDFPAHDLILYGESIGAGTAVQMATEFNAKALVIEAGFTSIMDMAQIRYPILPVRYFVWDKFDNLGKIGSVNGKIIILHGAKDGIIPITHAQALCAATRHKDKTILITVDNAGHNNIYDYLSFIKLSKHLDE